MGCMQTCFINRSHRGYTLWQDPTSQINVAKQLGETSKTLEERYGNKTGEIYFLASHSTSPEVTKFKNLIKISVTSNQAPRIRNADVEGTYLYSPVRILKILPCYNINVQGLETLIHTQLHSYRKKSDLGTGKRVKMYLQKNGLMWNLRGSKYCN